ncbi:MAG: DMT family transporter [Candidatus Anstonellales archaeon]
MSNEKGTALSYLTAAVSGMAVFANSFGVVTIDSTVYTLIKNVLVTLILAGFLIFFKKRTEILSLDKKHIVYLLFVGISGGGIAFALFFAGLAGLSGSEGSFLYRLLFIFSIPLAVLIFRERLKPRVVLGAVAILGGNLLLLGNSSISLNTSSFLVLLATVLWATEYAVSKKALERLSPITVASARMGIGSLVLLAIVLYQGKGDVLLNIPPQSLIWIAIATGFLVLFVTLWYSALKYSSLLPATAILTLGGPISAILSFLFAGKAIIPLQALGFLLLGVGAIFVTGLAETISTLNSIRSKSLQLLKNFEVK